MVGRFAVDRRDLLDERRHVALEASGEAHVPALLARLEGIARGVEADLLGLRPASIRSSSSPSPPPQARSEDEPSTSEGEGGNRAHHRRRVEESSPGVKGETVPSGIVSGRGDDWCGRASWDRPLPGSSLITCLGPRAVISGFSRPPRTSPWLASDLLRCRTGMPNSSDEIDFAGPTLGPPSTGGTPAAPPHPAHPPAKHPPAKHPPAHHPAHHPEPDTGGSKRFFPLSIDRWPITAPGRASSGLRARRLGATPPAI